MNTADKSIDAVCTNCGKRFLKRRPWHKWCSAQCREDAYRQAVREALRNYRNRQETEELHSA